MTQATGYILPLDESRLELLAEELTLTGDFAQPVKEFIHSRHLPLVCFVTDTTGTLLYLADGKRGHRAGTRLRRLNLTAFTTINREVRLDSYLGSISARHRNPLSIKLRHGGLLTANQFTALVDSIVPQDDELARLLARYSSTRAERLGALSTAAKVQLAFQKEAVSTAMAIAGLDRTLLRQWDPPPGAPISFLEGMPHITLREDAMIANDLGQVPGFDAISPSIHGSYVFRGPSGGRLTVILANRLPLEELTGADLIYYNDTFRSFVMVQYKAMEHSDRDAIFRLPNKQLDTEIQRMDVLVSSIEHLSNSTTIQDFRLSWQPFFLKFCPRVVFNPDDTSLTKGMYIPLRKWKLLTQGTQLAGPRGGQALTFANVGRYLENSQFIMLVANGWIGTTAAQSTLIEEAIRRTLESGRAAVIAVHTTA